MVGNEAQTITKHLKDRGIIRIAQARGGLDQCIEYFLHVERRPADDLQNIGSGRLLLESLRELALAGLLGLEQARVLDGDHRLVGEGLQQINLSLGKWAHLRATQDNCPYCFASTNKGDDQHGVEAKPSGERTGHRIFVRLRLPICEVNRLSVEDCPPDGTSTRQGPRLPERSVWN